MATLAVQPASAGVMHCYALDGATFSSAAPALIAEVPGVQSVHLVTAGRSPENWCLVLGPAVSVELDNAHELSSLVLSIARSLGVSDVQLLRPLVRRDAGPATDIGDWLTW